MTTLNNYPKSHHIFLYPFKFNLKGQKGNSNNDPKNVLEKFCEALEENQDWERKNYEFDKGDEAISTYNEYTYFYDFIQTSLYDTQLDKNEPVRYLRYKTSSEDKFIIESAGNNRFTIEVDDNKQITVTSTKQYQLDIISINIHIFSTQVGVLTFELSNYNHSLKEDDILLINTLGRRIYPQFLGKKTATHVDNISFFLKPYGKLKGLTSIMSVVTSKALAAPQQANYIPSKIIVKLSHKNSTKTETKEWIEDFTLFENPDKLWNGKHLEMPLPKHIKHLFPESHFSFGQQGRNQKKINIETIMDDRMFTMCWYGNDELATQLGSKIESDFGYEHTAQLLSDGSTLSKFWYAFTQCDADKKYPTITHPRLMKDQIHEFTYERWASYGTLYGITRDTFMVLSSDIETLLKHSSPRLDQHLQRMYYQMVILCLVQRASLLRFRNDLKLLTIEARNAVNNKNLNEDIVDKSADLYLRFLDFMNQIYFREVTPQIQGDEIYEMIQKQMRIRPEVEALDREISELNAYIESTQTQGINRAASYLVPLTIVSLLFGFIGIDKFANPFTEKWYLDNQFALYLGLLTIVTILSMTFSKFILSVIRNIGK